MLRRTVFSVEISDDLKQELIQFLADVKYDISNDEPEVLSGVVFLDKNKQRVFSFFLGPDYSKSTGTRRGIINGNNREKIASFSALTVLFLDRFCPIAFSLG